MRLLLDTQAFLWFVLGDRRLTRTALGMIGDPLQAKLVSDLLASNAAFQALVAKSKAGPRKPFTGGSGS